eukprot:scaffold876_cov243-Pinguiococcus_pyrenoidosus.AAC.44
MRLALLVQVASHEALGAEESAKATEDPGGVLVRVGIRVELHCPREHREHPVQGVRISRREERLATADTLVAALGNFHSGTGVGARGVFAFILAVQTRRNFQDGGVAGGLAEHEPPRSDAQRPLGPFAAVARRVHHVLKSVQQLLALL